MSTFAKTAMGMFKTTAMMTGNFDWLFHCDCTGLIDLSEEDDPWSQMTRNAGTRLRQSITQRDGFSEPVRCSRLYNWLCFQHSAI